MRVAFLSFIIAMTSAAGADEAQRPPEWLAGYWLSCEGGAQTAEAWLSDGSGTMVGVNQSKDSFEHMRIAASGDRLAFFASPKGQPPAVFPIAAQSAASVVFENAAHDFPQRVSYERRGAILVGRIEGVIDGTRQGAEWRFKKAAIGERCH